MPAAGSIALLLDTSPTVWTSVDEFHFRLCRAFHFRGVLPIIVYAAVPPEDYRTRMESSGAQIFTCSYSGGRYSYFRELRRLFRKYRVQIIQTRGFNYFALLWWMLFLLRVKSIFLEGNGGLLRARLWKRVLLGVRGAALTFPITRVVTVSRFIKDQLIQTGVSEHKIIPIYNGVDLDRFRPDPCMRVKWRDQYGIRPDEWIISTVSYLKPIKNIHTLIEACAILAARGMPVQLFIAGSGELLASLQALSVSLGIAERTHWLGNFGQPEKLLQAADVLGLASTGEAIGNVLLEAMGCGVPCVGARSGGIPEIIDDGKTGFLVPPLDAGAFADAFRTILEKPELRAEMSRRSVERARERFDLDLTVRNFLGVYEQLWNE